MTYEEALKVEDEMRERDARARLISRNLELYNALDELVGDWIARNPTAKLTTTSISEFRKWAHAQTINPT